MTRYGIISSLCIYFVQRRLDKWDKIFIVCYASHRHYIVDIIKYFLSIALWLIWDCWPLSIYFCSFQLSDPTVGVDFFARIIELKDGTRIKLQLWDTAGQERFRSITKSYYRNSVGVLLVYDITNHASFEHIPLWMMEAKRHIEPHRPVFALTGCKLDLGLFQMCWSSEKSIS